MITQSITDVLQRRIGDATIPGALVLVSERGRVAYIEAHGAMGSAPNRLFTTDTPIASSQGTR